MWWLIRVSLWIFCVYSRECRAADLSVDRVEYGVYFEHRVTTTAVTSLWRQVFEIPIPNRALAQSLEFLELGAVQRGRASNSSHGGIA